MAAVLKCTKIVNTGLSLFVSDSYRHVCHYTNPATVPPTPGSVTIEVATSDVTDPAAIMSQIDDALELIGSNTMDWTI